ncbi:MAG: polysaccharide deacetylase family protein [Gemmatimonadaceae bacterium]
MRAILTYHSIDDSGSPISIDAAVFRRQMEFLARGRPRVVPLADIVALDASADAVALTFDDGFANFAAAALPLLVDCGFPATVFVVTDHVGALNDWSGAASGAGIPSLPLMSWDALGALAVRGIEVGAHTRRHPYLTSVSAAAVADEVEGAALRITAELGRRPTSFAYPYGDLDDIVVAAARRCYERACSTEFRVLTSADDALRLPRLEMYYLRAMGQLEQWGTASFERRLWMRAQGRRVRQLMRSATGGRA